MLRVPAPPADGKLLFESWAVTSHLFGLGLLSEVSAAEQAPRTARSDATKTQ